MVTQADKMALQTLTIHTVDDISWYCERQGSGPDLILVPSGEGDCSSFARTAAILSSSFTVTTFDMPGMSRTRAPRHCYQDVTAPLLADQIVRLMDKLSITAATFFGSSSGGAAVLAISSNHPRRILRAVVHEIPMGTFSQMSNLISLPDDELIQTCQRIFATVMNEDTSAWDDLGPEYHARLEKNFPIWARNYIETFAPSLDAVSKSLKGKPITWTVGALTPVGSVLPNIKAAYQSDIDIGLLPCKHFPHVSIPDRLADHIREAAIPVQQLWQLFQNDSV